ncbi:MAG: histone deacetylase, partial [Fidelibacterota bacterium]
PAGARDQKFLDIFRNAVPDIVLQFDPDLILLSAGFDAHQLDPIGGLRLSTEAFAVITEIFKTLADECCSGRLLSVLEGGYSFEALAESVYFHLKVLME